MRNASLGWAAPYQLLADELETGFKAALREAENFVRPGAGSAWPLNRQLVSPLIFLCHSSADKPAVRELYRRLVADGFAPWLDEEDIPPGANWELAIRNAVRAADFIVVCLSRGLNHDELATSIRRFGSRWTSPTSSLTARSLSFRFGLRNAPCHNG